MEPLKVKVILGSVRAGRFSEHSAHWIMDSIAKHPEFSAELVDLKDYPLPLFDHAVSPGAANGKHDGDIEKKWAAKIADADAFIFVTPEYNRSIPGALKNAIDYIYPEWNKKVFGIVTHGTLGGGRAAEHLRAMGVEMQMASVRQGVHIMAPWALVDENNTLKPGALDEYVKPAETMLGQLAWWGSALRAKRNEA